MPARRRTIPAPVAAGVLLAAVTAACGPRTVARTDAPAPVPPPVPPVVIPPSPPILHAISVCVVENGALREMPLTYDSATGDTLVDGRPWWENQPTSTAYAAGAPWYIRNELIALGADRYLKYGIVRRVQSHDLARVGEYGGVPLFVDVGEPARPPEIVYVPVRPGCEFQAYARDLVLRGVRG